VRIMVEARDAICAGDQDFVFTDSGVAGISWAYPGTPDEQSELSRSWSSLRNFPDGLPPHLPQYNDATIAGFSYGGQILESLLQQVGRDYWRENCTGCTYFSPAAGSFETPVLPLGRPSCCVVAEARDDRVDRAGDSLAASAAQSPSEEILGWNPMCFDLLDTAASYIARIRGTLADAVADRWTSKGATSSPCGGPCPPSRPFCNVSGSGAAGSCITVRCKDVVPYCLESGPAGFRARQACPQTCGCQRPRGPLALSLPRDGCSPGCTRSGEFRAALASLPCADVEKTDPDWLGMIDNMAQSGANTENLADSPIAVFAGGLRAFGCDYLAYGTDRLRPSVAPELPPPYIWGINFCVEAGSWLLTKPLSLFCPVACGCYSGDAHCPTSCPMRNSTTPLCPEWQKHQANSFPASTSCALSA